MFVSQKEPQPYHRPCKCDQIACGERATKSALALADRQLRARTRRTRPGDGTPRIAASHARHGDGSTIPSSKTGAAIRGKVRLSCRIADPERTHQGMSMTVSDAPDSALVTLDDCTRVASQTAPAGALCGLVWNGPDAIAVTPLPTATAEPSKAACQHRLAAGGRGCTVDLRSRPLSHPRIRPAARTPATASRCDAIDRRGTAPEPTESVGRDAGMEKFLARNRALS